MIPVGDTCRLICPPMTDCLWGISELGPGGVAASIGGPIGDPIGGPIGGSIGELLQ